MEEVASVFNSTRSLSRGAPARRGAAVRRLVTSLIRREEEPRPKAPSDRYLEWRADLKSRLTGDFFGLWEKRGVLLERHFNLESINAADGYMPYSRPAGLMVNQGDALEFRLPTYYDYNGSGAKVMRIKTRFVDRLDFLSQGLLVKEMLDADRKGRRFEHTDSATYVIFCRSMDSECGGFRLSKGVWVLVFSGKNPAKLVQRYYEWVARRFIGKKLKTLLQNVGLGEPVLQHLQGTTPGHSARRLAFSIMGGAYRLSSGMRRTLLTLLKVYSAWIEAGQEARGSSEFTMSEESKLSTALPSLADLLGSGEARRARFERERAELLAECGDPGGTIPAESWGALPGGRAR